MPLHAEDIPQLHAEIVLDIVVVPVILPQLVSGSLRIGGHAAGSTLQIAQMRLRVVPVCGIRVSSGDGTRELESCTPVTVNSSNSSSSSRMPSAGCSSSLCVSPIFEEPSALEDDASAADMVCEL